MNNFKDFEFLLKELISKQINNVPIDKKLQYSDLRRICKYIRTSIFDENNCCIWNGYVTNANSKNKGTYINFYFRKKKAALHRLLYSNFIGQLRDDEYLKFNCENKGRCCNIEHLKKFKYHKPTKLITELKNESIKKKKINTSSIGNKQSKKNRSLTISFD